MASSSSTEHKWKYDVFLSFRGEDTRCNFVSHLYNALKRNQVKTFIDYKLKRGEEIAPELLTTIEESRISVIIFSENYASSWWCLDELVKILECQKKYGQIVLPVFYRVDPSDVRNHKGSFGKSFTELQKNFKGKMDKVRRWKEDLNKAANIAGWNSQNVSDDSELVNKIAKSILEKLSNKLPTYSKDLVGMDLRVKEIKALLHIVSSGVRIVGIWGIGGIGKTTIAEEVFHNISNEYERCCFLSNVGQELKEGRGLTHLRQELFSKILGEKDLQLETPQSVPISIRNRLQGSKVLAVLDDVDDHIQLEGIIESRDLFGDGSRIVVIARDKQAFNRLADEQYEVKGLNDQEACQLFSLVAFKRNTPPKGYMGLSLRVMNYANGHPLALKALADFLYGKDEQVWESELNELEHILEPTLDVLKLGVDKLHDKVKSMFLDIACFFRGEHADFVMEILSRPNFSANAIFPTLIGKGLIKLSNNNKVEMHDLVQQMAHKIVQQDDLDKRHRFLNPDDSYELLTKYEGTRNVEALFADISRMKKMELSSRTFEKMHNLRLLKFYKSRVGNGSKVDLPHGLTFLSDRLRHLHWEEYPLRSLPSDFDPENLVVLNLSCSNVERLWNENKTLANLKEINLSNCKYLTAIPELTAAPNLERLNLQFCTSLLKIPSSSIQNLKKLIDLDLRGCTNLMTFPRCFDSTSLKTINLSGCPHLKKYPKIADTAAYLNLSGTAIEELPQSITHLSRLVTLNLKDCKQLDDLPSNICSLKSLVIADFSGCSNITSFPVVSQSVRYLCLGGTAIEQLPSSIGQNLPLLSLLDLRNCKRLKIIVNTSFIHVVKLNLSGCSCITNFPKVSWKLKELYLDETAIQEIPSSIQHCSQLVELHLKDCTRLETVPESISKLKSLRKLNLSGCSQLRSFPDILERMDPLRYLYLDRTGLIKLPALKLEYLLALNLVDCQLSVRPESLSYLSSLEVLDLSGNIFEYLPDINKLSELQYLGLRHCKNLLHLPELPPQLTKLDLDNCGSLSTMSTSTSVVEVSIFDFCLSRCYSLETSACNNIIAHVLKKIELYCRTLQNTKIWDVAEGEISCCFPGEVIPCWFAQRNHGSSITIHLPSDWPYSEFMGFTLCCVVDFRYSQQVHGFQIKCRYHFKNTNGDVRFLHCEFGGWYDDRNVNQGHLFLGFDPCLGVRIDDWFDECREIVIEFYPQDMSCNPLLCCEVVRCGVHLLYGQGEVFSFDHENVASISSTISTRCKHYRRRCMIRAPCCNMIFSCRHCHNEAASMSKNIYDRHELNRCDVKQVVCSICDTEQPVAQVCTNCGVNMGEYFCQICKLYDDDVGKGLFHCDDCGICRVGGRENFSHCEKCGYCYSSIMRDNHLCVENSMQHDCPLCYEYLDSLEDTTVMKCGHTMHCECFHEMVKRDNCFCPICSKSIIDMSKKWKSLDEEIEATVMPEVYRYRKVWILCNDCNDTTEVYFHIIGQKCSHCKSYNTRTIAPPVLP